MGRVLICFALGLMAVPAVAAKHAAPGHAIPTAAAAQDFAEAQSLCQRDAWALWGRSLCVPMMFVDPDTRQAVLNGPATGAVADGPLYRVVLPSDMQFANTSLSYDGKLWSMVIWPLPKDTEQREILLMHESYHSIQGALGLQGSGGLGQNEHMDTRNGRLWFRMELAALRVALKSSDAARSRALSDALMFRNYRRSLSRKAAREERGVELNEGLAESTGIDVTLSDPQARIAAALADMDDVEKDSSYVRSFAYATGPAYAELLDAAQPAWRQQQMGPGFDFGNTAATDYHVSMKPPDLATLQGSMVSYGGPKISAEEDKRDVVVQARNARYTAALVSGETLSVALGQFAISFDPRDVHALQYRGSVYENISLSGGWGSLKVSSGMALIPAKFDKVILPLKGTPVGPHLKGAGWKLDVKPGYTLKPDPGKHGSWMLVAAPAPSP
ncbi:MAG TPA: hypothetical protein VGM47_08420 [Gammaproteobacteria bacterium]|jgi:hypothetical protein